MSDPAIDAVDGEGAGADVRLIEVPYGASPTRLDVCIAAQMEDHSRAAIQDWIQRGLVTVNGIPVTKKNHRVAAGDEIAVDVPPPLPAVLVPSPVPLDVIYEDDDVLVINKPAGITVHPGSGTGPDTLVHRLLHHVGERVSLPGHPLRPGIVHRLDCETTGIMVMARSDVAYLRLVEAFAGRKVHKVYRALAVGCPALQSGSWQQPIGRHPSIRVKMAAVAGGKPAHTDWRVVRQFASACLLACTLHSGRTHQIRVHAAHAGHPLLGDSTYGFRAARFDGPPVPRVMLHASELSFSHPRKGTTFSFHCPDAADFSDLIARLESGR